MSGGTEIRNDEMTFTSGSYIASAGTNSTNPGVKAFIAAMALENLGLNTGTNMLNNSGAVKQRGTAVGPAV